MNFLGVLSKWLSQWNPDHPLTWMKITDFNAPYLPWVLMGFSIILQNDWPYGDILGFAIGHIYYFLEDVYPRMPSSGGRRLLQAPTFVKDVYQVFTRDRAEAALPEAHLDENEDQVNEEPLPQDFGGADENNDPNDGPRQRRAYENNQ
jgi:hypothetical protein